MTRILKFLDFFLKRMLLPMHFSLSHCPHLTLERQVWVFFFNELSSNSHQNVWKNLGRLTLLLLVKLKVSTNALKWCENHSLKRRIPTTYYFFDTLYHFQTFQGILLVWNWVKFNKLRMPMSWIIEFLKSKMKCRYMQHWIKKLNKWKIRFFGFVLIIIFQDLLFLHSNLIFLYSNLIWWNCKYCI